MPTSRFDCLCAGIVVADHVCAPVDHLPAPGELVLTERMELSIGGCASNVAVDLARLGVRVGVAGTVGNDTFGRFCRETLEHAGVDCAHLRSSATHETSGTLVINTRGQDRRFIHSIGANDDFTGAEITPDLIARCRVLTLGGYCLSDRLSAEHVARAFRAARDAGVITVLDVVIPRPGDYAPLLKPVLPLTDLFLPNADEARVMCGRADPLQQAECFRQWGAGTVVVTCGGEGAVLVDERRRLQAGAFDVDFVDGTGSGDAFVAGFVYGLLRSASAEDCLRFGSALGASAVRATGATTGVFTAGELSEFLAKNPLKIEPV